MQLDLCNPCCLWKRKLFNAVCSECCVFLREHSICSSSPPKEHTCHHLGAVVYLFVLRNWDLNSEIHCLSWQRRITPPTVLKFWSCLRAHSRSEPLLQAVGGGVGQPVARVPRHLASPIRRCPVAQDPWRYLPVEEKDREQPSKQEGADTRSNRVSGFELKRGEGILVSTCVKNDL
jgi:hypothetical protein